MDNKTTASDNRSHLNDNLTTVSTDTGHSTNQAEAIFYIVIGVIGTCSNLFSLTVLCSAKSMRSKMINMLLINQSAIDMVTSIVMAANGPSVSNAEISHSGIHGYFYCVLWASKLILWSLMLSSAYNLLCINIERYLSIVFPFFHKARLRKKYIYIAMGATWIFGPVEKCLFTLPTSALRNGKCLLTSIWPDQTTKLAATVTNEVLNFGLPVLVTILIYLHMAITLRRISKEAGSSGQLHSSDSQRRQQIEKMTNASQNILKTMAMLTGCYLFCWTWNSVYFSLYIAGKTRLTGPFYHFTVYILFLNSVINPFIYTAQYRDFRAQMIRLIVRRENGNSSQPSTVSYSVN